MLVGQFVEERLLEARQRSICVTRNGNGLRLVFCCVDLDQVLQLVIIDIVWRDRPSAHVRFIKSRHNVSNSHDAHCGTDCNRNVCPYFIPSQHAGLSFN